MSRRSRPDNKYGIWPCTIVRPGEHPIRGGIELQIEKATILEFVAFVTPVQLRRTVDSIREKWWFLSPHAEANPDVLALFFVVFGHNPKISYWSTYFATDGNTVYWVGAYDLRLVKIPTIQIQSEALAFCLKSYANLGLRVCDLKKMQRLIAAQGGE